MSQDNNIERKNIPLVPKRFENDGTPIGYESAKIIGIIYESGRGEEIPEIVQLINVLNNDKKDVFSLKFISQSVSKENLAEISANTLKKYTLSKKDINLFGRPKIKSVKGFTETWFDILIYLSTSDIPAMHRLVSSCKARLKVAPYNEKYLKVYQMMIDDKEGKETGPMIESLMKYLKMLNNTNEL